MAADRLILPFRFIPDGSPEAALPPPPGHERFRARFIPYGHEMDQSADGASRSDLGDDAWGVATPARSEGATGTLVPRGRLAELGRGLRSPSGAAAPSELAPQVGQVFSPPDPALRSGPTASGDAAPRERTVAPTHPAADSPPLRRSPAAPSGDPLLERPGASANSGTYARAPQAAPTVPAPSMLEHVANAVQGAAEWGWGATKEIVLGYPFSAVELQALGSIGKLVLAVPSLGVLATAASDSGPGEWQVVNEAMSDRAAAYQEQITGVSGKAYVVKGVRFDDYTAEGLVDAKGPGYAGFVSEGRFQDWWAEFGERWQSAGGPGTTTAQGGGRDADYLACRGARGRRRDSRAASH